LDQEEEEKVVGSELKIRKAIVVQIRGKDCSEMVYVF
jgi:hypothetical protein